MNKSMEKYRLHFNPAHLGIQNDTSDPKINCEYHANSNSLGLHKYATCTITYPELHPRALTVEMTTKSIMQDTRNVCTCN